MNFEKAIFTPGPVKISEDILALGALQTPYFRNSEFSEILMECEEILLELCNAPPGSRVVFLTASGTGAMEAAVTNTLAPDRSSIVINGGDFGQRFCDIFHINGYTIYEVESSQSNLASTDHLSPYTDADALCINAHETSIGLLYDLTSTGKYCASNNMLHIVDAISMFVTDSVDMQSQSIDVLILSSNKGLGLPPGLSMVLLSPRSLSRLKPSKSFYFDFHRYLIDGERGQTPFTPAVTITLQLHKRLLQITKEGIAAEQRKAEIISTYFRDSIQPLPLEFFSSFMPNAMTALTPTDGKSAFEIVRKLDTEYGICVAPNGGALKDKVFRVSHMGDMTIPYVDRLIDALFDLYGIQR